MRKAPLATRQEIVAIAKADESFRDIVGRPSLLYNISQIWDDLDSEDRRERITSALVVGKFLESSYRRQTLKASEHQEQAGIQADQLKAGFMALSEAERAYFMEGIAVYMAAQDLPNQISGHELNDTVEKLLETIPEGVPATDTIIQMGNRAPLRTRIQEHPDGLSLLKTNIRTYGVLVDDPSRYGSFQFAHKSFFEYLIGAYCASKLEITEQGEDFAKNFRTAPHFDTVLNNREFFWMTADKIYSSFDVESSKITGEFILKRLGISFTAKILHILSRLPFYGMFIHSTFKNIVVRRNKPHLQIQSYIIALVVIISTFMMSFDIVFGRNLEGVYINDVVLISLVISLLLIAPMFILWLRIRTLVVKMLLVRYLSLRYLGAYQGRSFRQAVIVKVKTPASLLLDYFRGCSIASVLDRILIDIHLAEPNDFLVEKAEP